MYSLESPHRGDFNEYTQHTIIVKEIKKIPKLSLLPDLAPWLTLSGSNYPCVEQFSMVPKMFEPLKFDFFGDNLHEMSNTPFLENKEKYQFAVCWISQESSKDK